MKTLPPDRVRVVHSLRPFPAARRPRFWPRFRINRRAVAPRLPAAGGGAPAAQSIIRRPRNGGGGGGQKGGGSFLGKDVAFVDPGTETAEWDGRHWNINNNRILEARFEKYLNAPEETSAVDQQYQRVIAKILNLLAPGNATVQKHRCGVCAPAAGFEFRYRRAPLRFDRRRRLQCLEGAELPEPPGGGQ